MGWRRIRRATIRKLPDYMKSVAKQGNVAAQTMLGIWYDLGEGVSKDDAKAVYWYTKAAKQGNKKAQTRLGLKYINGHGVPEYGVCAYAWSSIAAAQGNAQSGTFKEAVAKHMTPAQIAEGQKLSRELWGKYVVPFQKK